MGELPPRSRMRARDHFRAHGRHGVTLAATLRAEFAPDQASVRVKNLSLGGALIELVADEDQGLLRLDAPLLLELVAPSLWDPLVLRGRVAWLRRASADRAIRTGIRFEHREEGGLFTLFQLLAAQS